MKRVKDNITNEQFKVLMSHLRGDVSIRENRKQRLHCIFLPLYYTGLRVNETTQFKNSMLLELINTGRLIIKTHKTQSERVLLLTPKGQKVLKIEFEGLKDTEELLIQSERSTKELSPNSVIRDVNGYLKRVFGVNTRITSHSFRQTLITELANAGINTKLIQHLIGHNSINSTLRIYDLARLIYLVV